MDGHLTAPKALQDFLLAVPDLRLYVLANHKKASHINKQQHTADHELESVQHYVKRENMFV